MIPNLAPTSTVRSKRCLTVSGLASVATSQSLGSRSIRRSRTQPPLRKARYP